MPSGFLFVFTKVALMLGVNFQNEIIQIRAPRVDASMQKSLGQDNRRFVEFSVAEPMAR